MYFAIYYIMIMLCSKYKILPLCHYYSKHEGSNITTNILLLYHNRTKTKVKVRQIGLQKLRKIVKPNEPYMFTLLAYLWHQYNVWYPYFHWFYFMFYVILFTLSYELFYDTWILFIGNIIFHDVGLDVLNEKLLH